MSSCRQNWPLKFWFIYFLTLSIPIAQLRLHFNMLFCKYRNVRQDYVWVYVVYCCITFFCRLTTILVITLLNAIAEAMSNIREVLWVLHHLISSDLKVIASALLYCIRPSRYFHSSWICWHMLLKELRVKYSMLPLPV